MRDGAATADETMFWKNFEGTGTSRRKRSLRSGGKIWRQRRCIFQFPFLPPNVLPPPPRSFFPYAKRTAYGKVVYVGAYRLLYGVYGNNSPAGFCIKTRVIVFSEFAEI